MIILAHVSDLHVGSTVALSPDKLVMDDGHVFYPSKLQKWINNRWADYWQKVDELKQQHQAEVVTIINGEAADNNRHPTTQLITRHEGDLVNAALKALEPARAVTDRFIVTRGTEAHTGTNANLDEQVAKSLAAVRNPDVGTYSWWKWHGKLAGVRIDAAHHPVSGSSKANTQGAGAIRTAVEVGKDYVKREMPVPHLILRGHRHIPEDSYYNSAFGRCIINPAWQASTSFGHRLGGNLLPIGGHILGLYKGEIALDLRTHFDIPLRPWRELP